MGNAKERGTWASRLGSHSYVMLFVCIPLTVSSSSFPWALGGTSRTYSPGAFYFRASGSNRQQHIRDVLLVLSHSSEHASVHVFIRSVSHPGRLIQQVENPLFGQTHRLFEVLH